MLTHHYITQNDILALLGKHKWMCKAEEYRNCEENLEVFEGGSSLAPYRATHKKDKKEKDIETFKHKLRRDHSLTENTISILQQEDCVSAKAIAALSNESVSELSSRLTIGQRAFFIKAVNEFKKDSAKQETKRASSGSSFLSRSRLPQERLQTSQYRSRSPVKGLNKAKSKGIKQDTSAKKKETAKDSLPRYVSQYKSTSYLDKPRISSARLPSR